MKNFKQYSPSFCVIAPTAYLEHIPLTNTHLLLAHLVDKDDKYAEFYRIRSLSGDLIIMDNGAYELGESYNPDKLVELGAKCGADALVLPDYPFQPAQKTIDAAKKFVPLFKEAGFSTFFAPQSEKGDLEGWIHAYRWAAENPNIDIIGMSILGIPYALPHIPAQYARVVMTQLLYDRGIFAQKHHHYLGLNAGANVELPTLITMGALDTCDSSNPVWAGINGIKYNTTLSDWMGVQKKYLRHVNFDEPLSSKPHILEIVKYNVELTTNIFIDPQKYLS